MKTQPRNIDLSQSRIPQPLDAQRVGENYYGVATYDEAASPFLATCGVVVCKAIVMYRQRDKKGLIAQLSVGSDPTPYLLPFVETFDGNLEETDVVIAEAWRGGTIDWPTIESLAGFFTKHDPRSLQIDQNTQSTQSRGIALDLRDGGVTEMDGSNGWQWTQPLTPDFAQVINPYITLEG